MSVEDEKKKPRKAAVKKAVPAPSADVTAAKKVKAAAPKPAAPKKKPAARIVAEAPTVQPPVDATRRDVQPTQMQIAERAHHYFVERGRQHGFHEQDWLRAERELRSGS
ncbi:DUF2934 domain-containing protein [Edaphobacter modestus]|uniref:DUF2934 family protein n=1 Tax=Edaphobacter modestus TaxID=388466 RepID=A0A4Q7YWP5_9BACT|nr:DUF2934 domain-containing protein [Edaphobacter modestus]RZU42342.1 DUF2934 family protein [Edaphobacter modestus]